MTATDLFEITAGLDVNPFLDALVPGAVTSALHGDPARLIALLHGGGGGSSDSGDSSAVFIATSCEDMSPVWPVGTPIDQRPALIAGAVAAVPAAAFGGFGAKVGRQESIPELCRTWPESPITQPAPGSPAVPTLILSGSLDLRTPVEVAEQLAARLPDAKLVRVAGVGHSVLSSDLTGCATANAAAFMAGRSVSDCTKGKPLLPVLPPAPVDLRDVAPARGLHGTVGRVAAAAALTVADISLSSAGATVSKDGDVGFGGLRGGFISVRGRNARLHRYSYVKGVDLSGPARSTLTLRGPGGVRGRVRVVDGGSRVRGTIAGHRVDIRVENPLADALDDLIRQIGGDSASAMLAPWPTQRESTTSSSSARPGSPVR